jgi:hypothetical protein
MPLYATPVQIAVLGPPIIPPFPLFNAETLTAPAVSIPIQWEANQTGTSNNTKQWVAKFASAPSAAVINILGSNTNSSSSDYVIVGTGTLTFTGTQTTLAYLDTSNFLYYAVELVSVTGNSALAVTVNA